MIKETKITKSIPDLLNYLYGLRDNAIDMLDINDLENKKYYQAQQEITQQIIDRILKERDQWEQ